jgi:hypothetical protein
MVYTKIGRMSGDFHVALFDGDGPLDERTVRSRAGAQSDSTAVSLSATAELLVVFGAHTFGFKNAFPDRDSDTGQLARHVVELSRVADLPTDWFGYEAVDVLVISAADGELCGELAADARRYEAITRWVELGGRLVVLCGAQSAPTLLGKDGALARLAP